MVFALATLLDMNVPAYAVEAREYFLISRLALRFAPPVADTTIWAIQTLVSKTTHGVIGLFIPCSPLISRYTWLSTWS